MQDVEENKIRSAIDFLHRELKQGNIYAAFWNDNQPLTSKEFTCFKDAYEVQEYCYENTTDVDRMTFRTIGNIIAELEAVINNKQGLDPNELVHVNNGIGANPDANPLYNREGNAFTDALIDFSEQQQITSSNKSFVMTDEQKRSVEFDLMKSGMKEAYTPELVKQMEQGVPKIGHRYEKQYEDGNRVTATLHLNKSRDTDNYFFNKFDLELKKDGQENTIKQTFYNNRNKVEVDGQTKHVEDRFTLKEATNLLDGRPVYKTLHNKEGEEYKAWNKIDFKSQKNGNYEMKQYTDNYGFDLKKTLLKYPIHEMKSGGVYENRLMESLERGNLQKVTFKGADGKDEKLYISPNITFGSLNIYDENKQRIPTEKLVEKQYIQPPAQKQGEAQTNGEKHKETVLKPPVEKMKPRKTQKQK